MKKIISTALCFALFYSVNLSAQTDDSTTSEQSSVIHSFIEQNTVVSSAAEKTNEAYKPIIAYSAVGLLFAGTLLYGLEAWDWGDQKEFRWAHEGFFGKSTDSGGADKVGHMYAHYVVQRGFYNFFEWANFSRTECLWWSVGVATGIGTIIEVGDGFTGRYGYSWEDWTADVTGVALGAALEHFPTVDEFVSLSIGYKPTQGFKDDTKGRKRLHITGDYSGHKVMLNFKLAGFKAIGYNIPEFMRYIMIDVGYYTRGYTDYDTYAGTDSKKTRHPYIGISLNFMEVVKDFFSEEKRSSLLCRGLQQPFKYYHVPVGHDWDYTLK